MRLYFYTDELNTKRLSGRFSVDLGTYWDGTEKTFSISFPEDGTYLLYVRVHIVGANKMDAGSSVVLSGNGITATYPESRRKICSGRTSGTLEMWHPDR